MVTRSVLHVIFRIIESGLSDQFEYIVVVLTFIGLRCGEDGTVFFLYFFYIRLYFIYHLSYLLHLKQHIRIYYNINIMYLCDRTQITFCIYYSIIYNKTSDEKYFGHEMSLNSHQSRTLIKEYFSFFLSSIPFVN